jgi:hypothetical protein
MAPVVLGGFKKIIVIPTVVIFGEHKLHGDGKITLTGLLLAMSLVAVMEVGFTTSTAATTPATPHP